MSPKFMSLCLLMMVLLATATSLTEEESTVTTDSWKHNHHKPPKKHWPPTTQNDEEHANIIVEDSHKYKPPHKKGPWKKHPPSENWSCEATPCMQLVKLNIWLWLYFNLASWNKSMHDLVMLLSCDILSALHFGLLNKDAHDTCMLSCLFFWRFSERV